MELWATFCVAEGRDREQQSGKLLETMFIDSDVNRPMPSNTGSEHVALKF